MSVNQKFKFREMQFPCKGWTKEHEEYDTQPLDGLDNDKSASDV